jgi:hypothetical protein
MKPASLPFVLLKAATAMALAAATLSAAEPLIGSWQLQGQEVNGVKRESEPLTLRILPAGDKFTFAFAVPLNNIDFVSMSYTVKLDGTQADVKNARGEKVGIVQITKTGPSHYKLVMKGPNRPDILGQLIVSADGKTLTSESDSDQGGHPTHAVQRFSGP